MKVQAISSRPSGSGYVIEVRSDEPLDSLTMHGDLLLIPMDRVTTARDMLSAWRDHCENVHRATIADYGTNVRGWHRRSFPSCPDAGIGDNDGPISHEEWCNFYRNVGGCNCTGPRAGIGEDSTP